MTTHTDSAESWTAFESQVAALLRQFGYEIDHDTKIRGAQTDVLALSPRRTIPNLLIECKHHAAEKNKVGIDEVENFIARVQRLRLDGEIDHGYLVTNTGFTSNAKGSILGSNASKYVFLVTYQELLATLLDVDSYLSAKVNEYASSELQVRYVEQRVVDTTIVDGSIFDANPGLWHVYRGDASDESNPRYWILSAAEINELLSQKCAAQVGPHKTLLLHDEIQKRLRDAAALQADVENERADELDAEYQERVARVTSARHSYAKEVAARLGLPESKEVFTEIAENAPAWSRCLERSLGPPPPGLRTLWQKHLRQAQVAMTKLSKTRRATLRITENTPALAEEPADKQTVLLPMNNALVSLEAFLADRDANLYVILGDYGAGKTTLLQRWMWQLAERKLAARTDPSVRIPLLLNLREYNKVPDFSALIRGFLSDDAEMKSVSLRTFRQLQSTGHFVLLLDGFDEMLQRVTKADRRRCFFEIGEFLKGDSKVALAGRPGYFPDYQELAEVLNLMRRSAVAKEAVRCEAHCLQLMDGHELDEFLQRSGPKVSAEAKRLIQANANLHDIARRPVLTSMIMESATELAKTDRQDITVRKLYQVYTDTWVRREEDKSRFRVLIDATRKATFVRFLAMQMHLTERLSIPFRELGRQIREQFNLDDLEIVDHFSHDIRTCSFLIRSDAGEYSFIHKSFMEFFVVLEYERGDDSPFADRFNRPLIAEMKAFLSSSAILGTLQELKSVCEKIVGDVRLAKEESIKRHDFPLAGGLRDIEKGVKDVLTVIESSGTTMRFKQLAGSAAAAIQKQLEFRIPDAARQDYQRFLEPLKPLAERLSLAAQ
ncbi:MAG: hypothetical protein QOG67_166 [Verrucomicrobiota bacterium]|jgi:hypothetical protein